MTFVVVKEHPSLLRYVDDLQRKNAEALSFYPVVTFEREAPKGRLYLALLNGDPCGYIYRGALTPDVRLHQVCIQYDARRRLHGAAIVQVLEHDAKEAGCSTLTLRCGFDLDANTFWRSLGYSCTGTVDGGARRMRRINIWRKQIHPGLFALEHQEPERGRKSASLWTKHRGTGLITQFTRGAALRDFRASVEKGDP